MLVTCRICFLINNVSFSSTMVFVDARMTQCDKLKLSDCQDLVLFIQFVFLIATVCACIDIKAPVRRVTRKSENVSNILHQCYWKLLSHCCQEVSYFFVRKSVTICWHLVTTWGKLATVSGKSVTLFWTFVTIFTLK